MWMDLLALEDHDIDSQGGKVTDCRRPTGPSGHQLRCRYSAGLTRYHLSAHCCVELWWESDGQPLIHHDGHPHCLTHTTAHHLCGSAGKTPRPFSPQPSL